jgi:thioredoxin 1
LAALTIVVVSKRYRSAAVPAASDGGASKADADLSAKPLPRLVDLGSMTCIPCQLQAPVLEELKKETTGRLVVDVIDIQKDLQAPGKYAISVIPTQIFYDASGKELFRHEGFMSKEDIIAKWKEFGVDLSSTASSLTSN